MQEQMPNESLVLEVILLQMPMHPRALAVQIGVIGQVL